ncbi:MAG: hypothetical protein MJ217_03005 [Bacilli bacterium]|nr:hypothetical protein [Bacilli bacterium]
MSEEILDKLEDEETNKVAIQHEKFSFKTFFTKITNIFGLVSVVGAILAVLFVFILPIITIDLTTEGVALAKANAATIPEMSNYKEILEGWKVIFGVGTYDVWHNVGTSAVRETQNLVFNIPLLVGVVLTIAGAVIVAITVVTRNYGLLNKIAFACAIAGFIMLFLAPVWFYAVNPIVASTRYDTKLVLYEYGSINGHGNLLGTLLVALFGLVSVVFAGLLLPKPVETR